MVKNLPAMQETLVWSLGQEDLLENGMATHSSILAWRVPWTEEPGRLQSMWPQGVRHEWMYEIHTHVCISCEGREETTFKRKLSYTMKMSDYRSLQDLPFPLRLLVFPLGGGKGCAPRPGLSEHGWILECDFFECIYNPGTYKGWNPIFFFSFFFFKGRQRAGPQFRWGDGSEFSLILFRFSKECMRRCRHRSEIQYLIWNY